MNNVAYVIFINAHSEGDLLLSAEVQYGQGTIIGTVATMIKLSFAIKSSCILIFSAVAIPA